MALQKPSQSSKSKDHISCIERRLKLWMDGNLNDLVLEGRAIQQRLSNKPQPRSNCSDPDGRLAYSFAKLMFNGKTKHALDILSGQGKGRLFHLSEVTDTKENTTVRDVLENKHPSAAPLYPECLDTNTDSSLVYHPVIFETLDGSVIRAATLRTSGSAGPSGLDAYGWRRLCSSFKSASAELCCSIAILARHLCTSFVDPGIVLPLVSCRHIALDKNSGVCPIGVGEVVRRIIAKAILSIIGPDIQHAAGPLQLCAAIHSMRSIFDDEKSEGFLLVDASNAFNSLNRAVALQNTQYTCPAFSTILINTYRSR